MTDRGTADLTLSRRGAKRRRVRPARGDGPTPERYQHDTITLASDTILDERGKISQPFRVTSKLAKMQARNDISPAMRMAGEHFQALYRLAATGGVRAIDWQRSIRGGTDDMSLAVLRAREARDSAMAVLGHSTPIGCCAWFVLGEEISLRDWAIREGWKGRPLREETAKGILIGALSVLAVHFGFEKKSV